MTREAELALTKFDTATWRAQIDEIDPDAYLERLKELRNARLETYNKARAEREKRTELFGEDLSADLAKKVAQLETLFVQLDKKFDQITTKLIQIKEGRQQLMQTADLLVELQEEAARLNAKKE